MRGGTFQFINIYNKIKDMYLKILFNLTPVVQMDY